MSIDEADEKEKGDDADARKRRPRSAASAKPRRASPAGNTAGGDCLDEAGCLLADSPPPCCCRGHKDFKTGA